MKSSRHAIAPPAARGTSRGSVSIKQEMSSMTAVASSLPPMSVSRPKTRSRSHPDPVPQTRQVRAGAAAQASVARHSRSSPGSSLHNVAQGRVERRSRRGELRDALGRFQSEQRRKESVSKAEIARLKAAVEARDREIYELQNATVVIDTERIWGLEQQVEDLKARLARGARARDAIVKESHPCNWETAAADAGVDGVIVSRDASMRLSADAEHFGDSTMAQAGGGTPERSKSSFLTPPQASPDFAAATRCMRRSLPMPMSDVGVQAELPDPAKQTLETEVARLTAKVDEYVDLSARIRHLLATVAPSPASATETPPSSIAAIEGQVQSLIDTLEAQGKDLERLGYAIADLGFSGDNASQMMSSLYSGFRAARLELEYLTPGEISLPLTSHGAQVLDLLLDRLRSSARKAKDDEEAIDTYRELEQSLRKKVEVQSIKLEVLKTEMSKAQSFMDGRDQRIRDIEGENHRLRTALDDSARDDQKLKSLGRQRDQDLPSPANAHQAGVKLKDETIPVRKVGMTILENIMAEAASRTARLLRDISEHEAADRRGEVWSEQQQNTTISWNEARVGELERDIGRANESIQTAHLMICEIRQEQIQQEMQLEGRPERPLAVAKESQNPVKNLSGSTSQSARAEKGKRQRRTSPEVANGSDLGTSEVKREVKRSRRILARGVS